MHRYDSRGERATRDIVSRAMFEEIRNGNATPNGGVYIEMRHLGALRVSEQFKGMVKRCADCGFDLAGGRVEVVPTAHYMMGGVEFNLDCSTTLPGLFVAGEDAGGVHGANRLGGNGVANSTVFGGIAGDTMARFVREGGFGEPDTERLSAAQAACLRPLQTSSGNLNEVRERLHGVMWDKVGIVRERDGLQRALEALAGLDAQLNETGITDANRAFNLTWHDWLNLQNQILVSRAIASAALLREDSRGAHYRSDFPDTGDLHGSHFTRLTQTDAGKFHNRMCPVAFTRVAPGETLLNPDEAA
jgi:fumarate reductase flavoprotein subunit